MTIRDHRHRATAATLVPLLALVALLAATPRADARPVALRRDDASSAQRADASAADAARRHAAAARRGARRSAGARRDDGASRAGGPNRRTRAPRRSAGAPGRANRRRAGARRRPSSRRRGVDPRCTPAGIRALTGTAGLERRVRCLINRHRARSGLAPLRYNRCLDRAAERHARDMVQRRYFAHSSRRGGTPGERARAAGYAPRAGRWTVAENLAWGMGRAAAPEAIVRAWLRSAGHRANILHRGFRDVAVAVRPGAPLRSAQSAGTARATYVVDFGSRQRGGRCARSR